MPELDTDLVWKDVRVTQDFFNKALKCRTKMSPENHSMLTGYVALMMIKGDFAPCGEIGFNVQQ